MVKFPGHKVGFLFMFGKTALWVDPIFPVHVVCVRVSDRLNMSFTWLYCLLQRMCRQLWTGRSVVNTTGGKFNQAWLVVACVHNSSLPLFCLLSLPLSFPPPPSLPSLLSPLSFFFFFPGPKVSSQWLHSCSSTTSSSLSPTSPGECSRTRHSTPSSMTCLPLSSRCQPCIASAASEMVSRLSTYTLCYC